MQRLDNRDIFSVFEFNNYTNELLQSLPPMWVIGEISAVDHRDYYAFVTLKDSDATFQCYIQGNPLRASLPIIKIGEKVLINIQLRLYPKSGKFSPMILKMEEFSEGDLQRAFEQLKEELQQAGYFAQEHKRQIPYIPKNIGIITSRDGDAIHDIQRIISHRFPAVNLYLLHCNVQGARAVGDITKSIEQFNKLNNVDVIILTRGGGSLEDLAAYNTKEVALSIYNSNIPIISAIGHEKDITIADLVADRRASTPSNAAEIVVPDKTDILNQIDSSVTSIRQELSNYTNRRYEKLEYLLSDAKNKITYKMVNFTNSLEYTVLSKLVQFKDSYLIPKNNDCQTLAEKMNNKILLYLERKNSLLNLYTQKANNLNPEATLKRGYSIAYLNNNIILKDEKDIKIDETIMLQLYKGKIDLKRV